MITVDKEKLMFNATVSTAYTDKTQLTLTYAGRTVMEDFPATPSSMRSALDRMVDMLASHVEAEMKKLPARLRVEERLTRNQEDAGSIPVAGAKNDETYQDLDEASRIRGK